MRTRKGYRYVDEPPGVSIRGLGHVLPGRDAPGAVLSNERLTELMHSVRRAAGDAELPVSEPDFPERRIGIRNRCVLDADLSSRDLAVLAAKRCLQNARIDPDQLRAVIVTTVTPDQVVPCIASTVQSELGLPDAITALDVSLGCNGFMGGLSIAARQLQDAPLGDAVLLVAAETMTRVLDAGDRTTCTIFGDGAGAALLERVRHGGLGPVEGYTNGAEGPRIQIASSRRRGPMYRMTSRYGDLGVIPDETSCQAVVMDGRRVFKDMTRILPDRLLDYAERHALDLDDVELFAFHQANRRMIEAVARDPRLAISPERLLFNIEEVGNTTSASIPILLSEAVASGRLSAGQRVLCVGFGAGYSIGIAAMDWDWTPDHQRTCVGRTR